MEEITLIALVYVGKKPWTMDNVAGSGKAWNGAGDVQEVTVNQAKRLLKHPDQWALNDPGDASLVDGDITVPVTDSNGRTTEIPAKDLRKPLELMTKPQLVAFALAELKLELRPALSKPKMIDAIEEAQKGPDPLQPGVAP